MKESDEKRRRDKVVRNVAIKENLGQGLKQATDTLRRYLKDRNMNMTPERANILWTIYHLDTPFDIETLHNIVCESKINVCKVTVYNNLKLFVEAGIVNRFQPFIDSTHYYEKAFGQEPHGYQVCRRCGAIRMIQMNDIIGNIDSQLQTSFRTSQISLYAIGICNTCYKAERKSIKEAAKQREKMAKTANKEKNKKTNK